MRVVPGRKQRSSPLPIRRALLVGAAATVGACSLLVGQTAAFAASGGSSGSAPVGSHSDSLRDVAARVGLRIGTAVTPFELDHPDYRAVTADQFSAVTPGNEMKWETVEPTR